MEAILIWHGRISSCAPFPDHPQHPTVWFSGSSRNGIGPTVQAHPASDNSRRRGGRLPQRREFRTRWHERAFTARRGMGILRLPRRIRLPFLRLLSVQLRSLTQRYGDLSGAAPIYLLAFTDHVIRAAAAYWVDGKTLHYLTLEYEQKQGRLETVDRDLSLQLNRERRVPFSLPAPLCAQ